MRISDWSSDVCSFDLVQEAYAVLVELPDVAHIREPRAYLFTTARSVVLQHVRRSRIVAIEAVAEIDRLDIEHDERSPDRHAMAGQELRRIGALIAALPAKCREAFVLRKVQGLSQREIAGRMRISENTVEKHVGRSEEHTSELQSLMRISYAVFCFE